MRLGSLGASPWALLSRPLGFARRRRESVPARALASVGVGILGNLFPSPRWLRSAPPRVRSGAGLGFARRREFVLTSALLRSAPPRVRSGTGLASLGAAASSFRQTVLASIYVPALASALQGCRNNRQ